MIRLLLTRGTLQLIRCHLSTYVATLQIVYPPVFYIEEHATATEMYQHTLNLLQCNIAFTSLLH